jgi:hypothetical protein
MATNREVHYNNANDGITGRPDGVYLDQVEAREAEIIRAKREGREPVEEPENEPYVGAVLRTGAQVLQNGVGVPIPSETDALYTAAKDNEILAKPVKTAPAVEEPLF